jgi:hypothetical protein
MSDEVLDWFCCSTRYDSLTLSFTIQLALFDRDFCFRMLRGKQDKKAKFFRRGGEGKISLGLAGLLIVSIIHPRSETTGGAAEFGVATWDGRSGSE